jgi:hypothetical protein
LNIFVKRFSWFYWILPFSCFSIDPGVTIDDSHWKSEINKSNVTTEKTIA